jgi:hypothetical protein
MVEVEFRKFGRVSRARTPAVSFARERAREKK